jgi:hypothetical protein
MDEEDAPSAVSPQTVLQYLTTALTVGPNREEAEKQVRKWESESSPGFLSSLLTIVSEVSSIPEVREGLRVLQGKVRNKLA